jgi:transposase-like protein
MEQRTEWLKRIERQKRSGLGVAAWCRQEGLKEHQFQYWRGQLKRKGAESEARFVRVGTVTPVELVIGERLRLLIPANFDPALLKRLLEVLEC